MSQLVIWICLYIFQPFFGQYHSSLVKILKQIPLKYIKAASIVFFFEIELCNYSQKPSLHVACQRRKHRHLSNLFRTDLNQEWCLGCPKNTIPYKVGLLPVTSKVITTPRLKNGTIYTTDRSTCIYKSRFGNSTGNHHGSHLLPEKQPQTNPPVT